MESIVTGRHISLERFFSSSLRILCAFSVNSLGMWQHKRQQPIEKSGQATEASAKTKMNISIKSPWQKQLVAMKRDYD